MRGGNVTIVGKPRDAPASALPTPLALPILLPSFLLTLYYLRLYFIMTGIFLSDTRCITNAHKYLQVDTVLEIKYHLIIRSTAGHRPNSTYLEN